MLGSLLLPTTSRYPQGGLGAIAPIVARRTPQEQLPPPSQPAAASATYTPASKTHQDVALYSRHGASSTRPIPTHQAWSVDRQNTLSLTIETAEGDIATIHLSQSQRYTARTSTRGSDIRASDSMNLNMVVQGDLSANEAKSIDAVVKQIGDVAQNFFAGDIKKALDTAGSIAIPGESNALTAIDFDLQRQETRKAVTVYENIAMASVAPSGPTSAPAHHSDGPNSILGLLGGLMPKRQETPATAGQTHTPGASLPQMGINAWA